MQGWVGATVMVVAFVRAPFQCATSRHPEAALEESPPEALWRLSERFGATGNRSARDETLRFLVERYPSSRFAARAREQLTEDAGGAPDGG